MDLNSEDPSHLLAGALNDAIGLAPFGVPACFLKFICVFLALFCTVFGVSQRFLAFLALPSVF